MKFFNLFFVITVLSFAACLPKEDLVEPQPRENQSIFIDHGSDRNDVVYVSLENGKIVQTISPYLFDFYGNERGIFLNSFKHMRAAVLTPRIEEFQGNVPDNQFKYLTMDYENEEWLLDENVDYMLDLGVDENGNPFGKMLFRYERMRSEQYRFTYKLDKPDETFKTLETDEYYFGYSAKNHQFVELPEESEYDLIFAKYTDLVTFVNQTIDYIILGVLQHPGTKVKLLEVPFNSVTTDNFTPELFESQTKREIGWDWKIYDIDFAAFTIIEPKTYLIENQNGLKMKMRFVNYYNSVGISGHPTIEYLIF